jgi:anti-anti-sigma factor
MQIQMDTFGEWDIVTLCGNFVMKNTVKIKHSLETITAKPKPLIAIDLSQTPHIVSSAMSLLLNIHATVKEKNGSITIIGANEDIMSIIYIVGLDAFVTFYATRTEFEEKTFL